MKKIMFLVAMTCTMIMGMGTVWADMIVPGKKFEPNRGVIGELIMPISIVVGLLVVIVILIEFASYKNKNDKEEK